MILVHCSVNEVSQGPLLGLDNNLTEATTGIQPRTYRRPLDGIQLHMNASGDPMLLELSERVRYLESRLGTPLHRGLGSHKKGTAQVICIYGIPNI